MAPSDYQFRNLTSAIADRDSPLRQLLVERFGNVRRLQQQFRRNAGPLLVPGGTADPALVGAAFDLQTRLLLVPDERPRLPFLAFQHHPAETAVIAEVAAGAQAAAADLGTVAEAGSIEDQATLSLLGRGSWALALCTEVYRSGLIPSSPLRRLLARGDFTAAALLRLAPADALRQLVQLKDVAAQRLLPQLRPPYLLGPTFDASVLCPADADLISNGLLLDLKTRLGGTDREGGRADRLPAVDLYQLLGYALFDRSDHYRMSAIGIYSARYGNLTSWPLDHALATMAGEPVDLPALRRTVWRMLGGR